MAKLAQIWRFPIKSVAAERLSHTVLSAQELLPFDRKWALAHAKSGFEMSAPSWKGKGHFINGYKFPILQSIRTQFDDQEQVIELSHPNLRSMKVDLENESDREALVEWVFQLIDDTSMKPCQLVRLDSGLGDQSEPLISINSMASLKDLKEKSEREIEVERWRGNLWLQDLPAWEELDMIGKKIQIGDAKLQVVEEIVRCKMPMANPITGVHDLDVLKELKTHYDHINFGVFAKVLSGGEIYEGSSIEVIS